VGGLVFQKIEDESASDIVVKAGIVEGGEDHGG
jgi:hypothetical protein